MCVLEQSYPNPLNPITTISYRRNRKTLVTLTLHDLQGRQVRVLDAGIRDQGRHRIALDGSGLSSGPYFYRMTMERIMM